MTTSTGRPRPILEAIRTGAWRTLAGTLITAAVSFGVLNAQQATVAGNLVAALATLLTAVTAVLSQLHVLANAEPLVTPVSDPRNDNGDRLAPSDGVHPIDDSPS
ncbi:hypothetical protein [Amycolatopsis sp. CA-126428]|uniref:hypothetical protein n=1 Tax=Amycolatopsis sp. CA-126428 TaxID=2073158 RepID=UPI000CD1796D|nr:hypothetical protein [Amycolatopsis sp. CA-126428]